MNTLTQSHVSTVLGRLFREAEASLPILQRVVAGVSEAEQDRLMRSKTDYIDLYSRLKDVALPVSESAGKLLYMLARANGAQRIVEFGTSFGISALHLAAALRDNGGGRLITCEFEPSKVARARQNLADGGLLDLVEIREGDALQTLQHDLPDSIDLVFLDGAKSLYADVLNLLESRLRPGAFVIADNTDHCPDYLARVRSPNAGYLSVPFGDEVELSMRLG
ncbi:O-methyltransferase [Chitinimonas sp.]|uniref:O-methyltransferase n=1 Tax=Chitinimonas sp. TaxID=1934313 RepID=UPI002F947EC8